MFDASLDFTYSFPAVRGVQAGREYYIAMCRLKLIPKIFIFDEEEVPPEYRSQRVINKSRIPSIAQYMVENPSEYVFSSLTASIDGDIKFIPFDDRPTSQIGQLIVSMDARFLINDGQHRRAAIEEALKQRPEFGDETISVVFFKDTKLQRSQQMFSDLNKHAVNTTRSIGILYDFRDPLALATKEIVHKNQFLRQYVDSESPTLAKLSPRLYTLSSIYSTMKNLLQKTKSQTVGVEEVEVALKFWDKLYNSIPEWRMIAAKDLAASKLRSNYITGFSVFLEAVGLIGASLYLDHKDTSFSKLEGLSKIDWTKSNRQWVGRAISNAGRVSNSLEAVRLTANKIKMQLNIPMTEDDQRYENKLNGGRES